MSCQFSLKKIRVRTVPCLICNIHLALWALMNIRLIFLYSDVFIHPAHPPAQALPQRPKSLQVSFQTLCTPCTSLSDPHIFKQRAAATFLDDRQTRDYTPPVFLRGVQTKHQANR